MQAQPSRVPSAMKEAGMTRRERLAALASAAGIPAPRRAAGRGRDSREADARKKACEGPTQSGGVQFKSARPDHFFLLIRKFS